MVPWGDFVAISGPPLSPGFAHPFAQERMRFEEPRAIGKRMDRFDLARNGRQSEPFWVQVEKGG